MPNSVAVLTCMLPPGRSRNITLALYGSAPPIGGVIGAVLAGVFLQYSEWKWLFIILYVRSLLSALINYVDLSPVIKVPA